MTDAVPESLPNPVPERTLDSSGDSSGEVSTDLPADATPAPGFIARKVAWGKETAAGLLKWLLGARETHASVDVGFRAADRDRRIAAGVLAGGVAYRYFFWLLAVSILVGGTFGFIGGERIQESLDSMGIDPSLAASLAQGSPDAHARWWLVIVGAWLLLWTGYLGAKALVLVHAVVWGVTPPPVTNRVQASLAFTCMTLILAFSMYAVRWLRAHDPILGLIVMVAIVVVPFGLWLLVSTWLPHGDVTLVQLMPGAALVAVGFEALHIFTALFIGPKLSSATDLYGAIGIVGTILLWLYFIGRLMIGGATLSASLSERDDLTLPKLSLRKLGGG